MRSCSANGTLVASVATQADTEFARVLAASVVSAGFPCLVVQPTAQLHIASDSVLLLPLLTPMPVPRRRWCRSVAQYQQRILELHRAALWRAVLEQHLDLLAIDVALVLVSSPLPYLQALATHDSATPDVVGTRHTWALRHDLIWIRSTAATLAVATRAENRTWGTSLAFDEELSYGSDIANASCCHTQCLRRFVESSRGVTSPPTTNLPVWRPKTCRGKAGPESVRAAVPPPHSRIRWRGTGWQSDRYNHVAHRERFAKCTYPRSGCFRQVPAAKPVPGGAKKLRHYAAERMWGAETAFTSPCFEWLRGMRPAVLQLEGRAHARGSNAFGPDLGVHPQSSTLHANATSWPVHFFNPSVVKAPDGVCPRCAYVMSLRADCLHQCDASSPYATRKPGESFFRGTAILLLDSSLRRLGWTWLLNAPTNQVAPLARPELADQLHGASTIRFRARRGDADGFAPFHAAPVYDIRLMTYRGQLLATMVVPSGESLTLVQLQLTATPTADGGVTQLRAWASSRLLSMVPWAVGRNQALFSSPGTTELLVQPWFGVVGSVGSIEFERRRVACLLPNVDFQHWRRMEAAGATRALASRGTSNNASAPRIQRGSFTDCGTHPSGTLIDLDVVSQIGIPSPSRKRSKRVSQKLRLQLSLVANQTFDVLGTGLGARRISPTAHLLRIEGKRRDGSRCQALLGVGHLHRGDGAKNHKGCHEGHCKARFWHSSNGWHARQPFQFGYLYTHFFYTLHDRAPHRITATTGEFCIGAAQDTADCESTQFISGIEHFGAGRDRLLLTFGVNDCEAKVGVVALRRIVHMLRAMPGEEAEACLPE